MKNKPAFPQSIFIQSQPGEYVSAKAPKGMTLREYYAGLAMEAIARDFVRHPFCETPTDFKFIAVQSVQCADALIAELEKSEV